MTTVRGRTGAWEQIEPNIVIKMIKLPNGVEHTHTDLEIVAEKVAQLAAGRSTQLSG